MSTPINTTPPPDSSLTVDASVVVSILGQNYTLEGTLGGGLNVEYHADFDQAINLGPVTVIATEIATGLGYNGIATDIGTALTTIQGLPTVGHEIATLLSTASARITDLVINTTASTYEIGLALDLSLAPPTLLGVKLMALGFKVTSSPKAKPATGTGTTTS